MYRLGSEERNASARLRLPPYMMQSRFWFRKGKTENPRSARRVCQEILANAA